MRTAKALALGCMAMMSLAGTAHACDLEGFGYARMNPFAQHAPWALPADSVIDQSQSRPAAPVSAASTASLPASNRLQSTAAEPVAASSGSEAVKQQPARANALFVPISAKERAIQSQRFTATKD